MFEPYGRPSATRKQSLRQLAGSEKSVLDNTPTLPTALHLENLSR